MADEDLLKQDEKEQGKPKVVANETEIKHSIDSFELMTFIYGFTKCLLCSS